MKKIFLAPCILGLMMTPGIAMKEEQKKGYLPNQGQTEEDLLKRFENAVNTGPIKKLEELAKKVQDPQVLRKMLTLVETKIKILNQELSKFSQTRLNKIERDLHQVIQNDLNILNALKSQLERRVDEMEKGRTPPLKEDIDEEGALLYDFEMQAKGGFMNRLYETTLEHIQNIQNPKTLEKMIKLLLEKISEIKKPLDQLETNEKSGGLTEEQERRRKFYEEEITLGEKLAKILGQKLIDQLKNLSAAMKAQEGTKKEYPLKLSEKQKKFASNFLNKMNSLDREIRQKQRVEDTREEMAKKELEELKNKLSLLENKKRSIEEKFIELASSAWNDETQPKMDEVEKKIVKLEKERKELQDEMDRNENELKIIEEEREKIKEKVEKFSDELVLQLKNYEKRRD